MYNIVWLAEANRHFLLSKIANFGEMEIVMTLRYAEEGKEYIVASIRTDDDELNAFLFSLGCYEGEATAVITKRKGGMVISIKDGRYFIDSNLADAITVYEK